MALKALDSDNPDIQLRTAIALRAALAEPEQPNLDTERLDWLDTLPAGITIFGDASFPHSLSATPKAPGISHIRELIDHNRASREAFKEKNT